MTRVFEIFLHNTIDDNDEGNLGSFFEVNKTRLCCIVNTIDDNDESYLRSLLVANRDPFIPHS